MHGNMNVKYVYNSVTYRSQLLSNVVIRSESSTLKVGVKTGISVREGRLRVGGSQVLKKAHFLDSSNFA